ncbi:MAG TPA: PP2C family serine/threonine-protein phosphatase [Clostridia bacterium]|nr:PP2C family serine/threonine-protein phosphatase [Clostridia bacterium]
MRVIAAGWTDIGLQRRVNEDSFAVVQEGKEVELQGACYVVCDGLGGAQAGEVASRTAVETFIAAWSSRELSAEDTKQRLRLAVHEANAVVYRLSLSSEELNGMGTTLVALVPHAGRAYVCNVGDSRCYRLREGVLTQLTEDHTMAADMVRQGLLDPAYTREVSERNILTRAVGTAPRVEVDVVSDELSARDRYLLCSDGLWGTASESDLQAGLAGGSPEEAAHRLVDLANTCGGPDNSTAVVVDVQDDRSG